MRIMIVDDHALVRRGMAHVVRECFSDAVVEETSGAEEALRVMETDPVDVALVDVRMPNTDGLELLHDLRTRWPKVPVIVLQSFIRKPASALRVCIRKQPKESAKSPRPEPSTIAVSGNFSKTTSI